MLSPIATLGPPLVGLVLLVAAGLKAVDPFPFLDHVGRLRLTPPHWVGWIALAFLGFEAALGTLLLIGAFPLWLLPATAGLLLGLGALSHWGIARGRVDDCGCYGGAVALSPGWSLFLDLVYAALLITGWWGREARPWPSFVVFTIVVASGALAIAVSGLAVRRMRPFVDLSPVRPGRRWRSIWLPGHPPHLTSGERVVVYLQSDCPQCKKWLPVLNSVHRHESLPAVVGALAMEPEEAVAFQDEHRLAFPVVVVERRVIDRLVRAFPTALRLVDGTIADRWTGRLPEEFARRIARAHGLPEPSPPDIGSAPVEPRDRPTSESA